MTVTDVIYCDNLVCNGTTIDTDASLHVGNDATINGDLSVTGDATIYGTMTAHGSGQILGDLFYVHVSDYIDLLSDGRVNITAGGGALKMALNNYNQLETDISSESIIIKCKDADSSVSQATIDMYPGSKYGVITLSATEYNENMDGGRIRISDGVYIEERNYF